MATRKSPNAKSPIPIGIRRRAAALQSEKARSGLLLPGEDPKKLQALYADFHEYFRPASLVEASLIGQMVSSLWRYNRTASQESIALAAKAEELLDEHRKTYAEVDYDRLYARAAAEIAPFVATVNRTLAVCRNTFRGALADLEKVRKLKGDPTQPFLPAPNEFDCSTNFAEPATKPPARIFEMPPPPVEPAAHTPQPPAPEPQPNPQPEPEPARKTPVQWFESEDYVEPHPPAEPKSQPEEPKPLYDIHGNPIVIHKQVRPTFHPRDFQWTLSPEAAKLLKDPILAKILNPPKPPKKE